MIINDDPIGKNNKKICNTNDINNQKRQYERQQMTKTTIRMATNDKNGNMNGNERQYEQQIMAIRIT